MDLQRAIDEAAAGKNLLPVYAIAGPERTLVARAVDVLRGATVGKGPRGLCEDHYDAQSTRPAQVIDACRMLPMLSKWRLVLVRGIADWKADDAEQLIAYVNNPTPSTVLVMLAEKLDGRTRFATALKKKGCLFEAVAPPESDLVPWVVAEAKRRGATFAPGAAETLVLAIGADLTALSDALERLHLYAQGRAITEKDVDETVMPLREASIFDVGDAVGDRDVARGLRLVHDLLKQREPGLVVLTFVVRHVRLLARAKEAQDKRENLASVLRLPPRVADKIAMQAKRWSTPQLARALKVCARADERLKSGGGRDRDARVLEELLLTLAGRPGMGEPATA